MYKIIHNTKAGERRSFDEAMRTVEQRLGAGRHYQLCGYCDGTEDFKVRNVLVYHSPETDRYDLFVIEGKEEL